MSFKGHDIAKQLAEVDEQERKLSIKKALTLEKAFKSGDVDAIYKAQNYYNSLQKQRSGGADRFVSSMDGGKAILLDPYELSSSMGYYSKNTSISNAMLRMMARTPIPSAIIRTRKSQVCDFAKPQADKYSNGFKWEKVGVADEDLTDSDQKAMDKLTEFIMNCGDENFKFSEDKNFNIFTRKIIDDSLTLDAAAFEIIPYRGFEPSRFSTVDSSTIRFADTFDNKPREGRTKVNGYYPKYVQVLDGRIQAEFYPWELCYGIRNPSTNIYSNGYGRGELEDLITTVTNLLNADKYNGSIFKTGATPKGALMVKKGNITKDSIAQMRRDWNAMISGADQNGKTLILDAEAVEYVNMQISNKDMEYGMFYELMVRLACAIFTISPEEIGFTLKGSGGKGGINIGDKGGSNEEKDYSKDKGLKPLLVAYEGWINEAIIDPKTNGVYKFRFAGLEVESAKEEEERLIAAAAVYLTPDEIRAGKKMKPLPDGVGKYPLNPVIAQMLMGKQQAEQEQQAQDQEAQDAQFNNTSPFIEDEKDNDPFKKSFDEYFEKTYVNVD